MDVLNGAVKMAQDIGTKAAKKAGELKETTKLKLEIRSKEDFIERQYREIGKRLYEDTKDDDSNSYEEVFLINRTFEEIAELQKLMADITGTVKCKSCDADVDPSSAFCPKCGAKMENEAEDEDDEETIVTVDVEEPGDDDGE